ncbi:MAG TPA: hypothetical protein VEJ87_02930, partial [Acidimicrobiales bacterium]|nr:hypothetical protein [Acidimicrobiales bacterium]
MNPLDGPLPAEGGVHSPEGVRRIRALRFSHSAVVTAWRQREREMLGLGADVALATARSWNEGGKVVSFEAGDDEFALSARTLGTHPSVFVFDPRPIWKLMGRGDWDVFDFHEEPGSLAVGELLVLRWLDMFRRRRREPRHKGTGEAPGTRRAGRIPFTFYSAQNIPKHYPPPFRWIERRALKTAGGAYVCNEAAGDILL